MNDLIELTEYKPQEVWLTPEDRVWFMHRSRFSITPIAGSDAWLLDCGSTVGVAELPSGRRLRCTPKASVENIFYMLATAFDFRSPFFDQSIDFEQIDELFEFLVEHLANLIDQRLRAGLYRSYIEREENLSAVRGRIKIADDMRHNAVLRHRTYCQYTEFTWDIPENRIIRQTVFAMSRLVRYSDLQRRLATLDRTLGELDPAPLPLSVFDTFHYHRLNDDYQPIHRLCRLLLESASVSEQFGDTGFKAFLLDMNRLYESFLTVALNDALSAPWSLLGQHSSWLDENKGITIRPDLTMLHDRAPVLIADAKYKVRAPDDPIHADLYQMLAYCTVEDIDRGMLIYPKWEHAGMGRIAIRHSPIEIVRETIDLGGSVDDLKQEIERLANQLVEIAVRRSPRRSELVEAPLPTAWVNE